MAEPLPSANGNSLLCFAGEATYRLLPGTVPGAFLSGKRAAETIISHAEDGGARR